MNLSGVSGGSRLGGRKGLEEGAQGCSEMPGSVGQSSEELVETPGGCSRGDGTRFGAHSLAAQCHVETSAWGCAVPQFPHLPRQEHSRTCAQPGGHTGQRVAPTRGQGHQGETSAVAAGLGLATGVVCPEDGREHPSPLAVGAGRGLRGSRAPPCRSLGRREPARLSSVRSLAR